MVPLEQTDNKLKLHQGPRAWPRSGPCAPKHATRQRPTALETVLNVRAFAAAKLSAEAPVTQVAVVWPSTWSQRGAQCCGMTATTDKRCSNTPTAIPQITSALAPPATAATMCRKTDTCCALRALELPVCHALEALTNPRCHSPPVRRASPDTARGSWAHDKHMTVCPCATTAPLAPPVSRSVFLLFTHVRHARACEGMRC